MHCTLENPEAPLKTIRVPSESELSSKTKTAFKDRNTNYYLVLNMLPLNIYSGPRLSNCVKLYFMKYSIGLQNDPNLQLLEQQLIYLCYSSVNLCIYIKRICHECEGCNRKTYPLNHRLASRGLQSDDKL